MSGCRDSAEILKTLNILGCWCYSERQEIPLVKDIRAALSCVLKYLWHKRSRQNNDTETVKVAFDNIFFDVVYHLTV